MKQNKERRGIIYGYYQPATDKWYVGQTVNPIHRKSEHRKDTIKTDTKLARAFRKYGYGSFEYHILYETFSDSNDELKKDLNYNEIKLIAEKNSYKNGYNSTLGGDGSLGVVKSENTIAKFKEKMIGRTVHPDTRAKIQKTLLEKGVKKNEEKVRVRSVTNAHSMKKVKQYDLDGNEIAFFKSIQEAANAVGVIPCNISAVLNGRQYTSAGFIWKYA